MAVISNFFNHNFLTFFYFSKEDSRILKGYGILFMIFHHTFGLYALPPGTDTAWISPGLTHNAAIFKICVAIFLFITGYAMGWKPAPSAAFGSLFKTGFLHYFKFWKLYLFCLLLILLVSSAFPTPMLPSPASLNWQDWILTITGLQPCYADWWYMGVFAAASLILYPVSTWISCRANTLLGMAALLGLSLLLQQLFFLPGIPYQCAEIARFAPCFILGYMCAFMASHIKSLSLITAWGAFLILSLELLSIHLFSFSHAKSWTLLFLFTLWCLPWITRKLHFTAFLGLLGTYSALMWLTHRFIFGYYFSSALYGSHSYLMIYGATLAGSLLLAMIMQKLFTRLFHFSR